MAIILYKVDVRRRASLHGKLVEQQSERAAFGEQSFELYMDDNARHFGYIFLHWESLRSAHRFLESTDSKRLVKEWPIEEVIFSIPLSDVGKTMEEIEREKIKA